MRGFWKNYLLIVTQKEIIVSALLKNIIELIKLFQNFSFLISHNKYTNNNNNEKFISNRQRTGKKYVTVFVF